MKTLFNHLVKNKHAYGLLIVLMIFAGGVSFRKIMDKHTRLRKKNVEFIVIHYTANLRKGADAAANAKYLQKSERAGCHYAIDDVEVIQCVPEDHVAYAVGDKKWLGFIPKPWYDNKIKNENSISFEMCLGGGRNDSLIIDKTAQYVAWQLLNKSLYSSKVVQKDGQEYIAKIPDLSRVVRHHDVSGKHCPKFNYNGEWDQAAENREFAKFKRLVENYFSRYVKPKQLKNEILDSSAI